MPLTREELAELVDFSDAELRWTLSFADCKTREGWMPADHASGAIQYAYALGRLRERKEGVTFIVRGTDE
ncbi:MAG: hypothetical protein ACXABY_37340 [Candidatus Thorarchaeota archaeon]|jgi:hypothetical protein